LTKDEYKPKVLVGCPTSDYKKYCLKEYVDSVTNLTYTNYDILLVDNSEDSGYFDLIRSFNVPVKRIKYREKARERIVSSRNILVKELLINNYDYFLSLEQDVIPPKDVIERLLQHDKKVVAGVYPLIHVVHGKKVLKSSIWMNYDPKTKLMYRVKNKYILENPSLFEISTSGLGCVLIHKDVFKKIKFRYDSDTEGFDDVFFSKDLRDNKIPLYADFGVLCNHLLGGVEWDDIKK
jgi:GT2 family glycosyltransferase